MRSAIWSSHCLLRFAIRSHDTRVFVVCVPDGFGNLHCVHQTSTLNLCIYLTNHILQHQYMPRLSGIQLVVRLVLRWVKYARCVPLYPLNPIETWFTTPKSGCIFRPQFSPDAVGRRRPALRLRSFPRGCPPQAKIFSKKIKINDFLYEIYYFYCVYHYILIQNLCISWKICDFIKIWKIFENF